MGMKDKADAGLLGKVAKFIKNPPLNWSELDRNGDSSSQMGNANPRSLKELIERKRRNDFVRKREFGMLRKIHNKEQSNDGTNTVVHISSSNESDQVTSSIASKADEPHQREEILHRIDGIEAQVSRDWFRKPNESPTIPMRLSLRAAAADTRQRNAPSSATAPSAPNGGARQPPQAVRTQPLPPAPRPAVPSAPSGQPKPPPVRPMITAAETVLVTPPRPVAANPLLNGLVVESSLGEIKGDEWQRLISAPLSVRLPAVAPKPAPRYAPQPRRSAAIYDDGLEGNLEVATLQQDPVEEAAISFANGDDGAAESALLKLVSVNGGRHKDVDVWLVLFDLYRVTGKADSFDGLVPEFTALFGRSAPQWNRVQTDSMSSAQKNPALQTSSKGTFAWASPSQLNARAMTALTGATKRTTPPWRIDWRYIKTVDSGVLPQLIELFTQWADTPTQLQFLGGERLLAVLAEYAPTGDKSADPAWWNACLALLRLMGESDRFDQTALDYCITYEISPPAWKPSKNTYTRLVNDGQLSEESDALAETGIPSADFAPSTITGELQAATGVFETILDGEILGGANQVVAAMPKNLERVRTIDFDCRNLRRVDFGTAGDFLNWSIQQKEQGRAVVFHSVHRLLAVFLNVVGVGAVARVVLRND